MSTSLKPQQNWMAMGVFTLLTVLVFLGLAAGAQVVLEMEASSEHPWCEDCCEDCGGSGAVGGYGKVTVCPKCGGRGCLGARE